MYAHRCMCKGHSSDGNRQRPDIGLCCYAIFACTVQWGIRQSGHWGGGSSGRPLPSHFDCSCPVGAENPLSDIGRFFVSMNKKKIRFNAAHV